MYCYIGVSALLLYILYALNKFSQVLCTEINIGPAIQGGPELLYSQVNHDRALYSVLPGRICLIYKEKSIVRLYLAHPHVYAPGACPMLDGI